MYSHGQKRWNAYNSKIATVVTVSYFLAMNVVRFLLHPQGCIMQVDYCGNAGNKVSSAKAWFSDLQGF